MYNFYVYLRSKKGEKKCLGELFFFHFILFFFFFFFNSFVPRDRFSASLFDLTKRPARDFDFARTSDKMLPQIAPCQIPKIYIHVYLLTAKMPEVIVC